MLEGELLRRKAIEDLEAERGAERKRRDMAIKAQKETQKANEYLKQIKVRSAGLAVPGLRPESSLTGRGYVEATAGGGED